jgi:hypothetical protein
MIYELRIYRAMPGRLADVVDRFQQHTVPLWDKHRIHHVGFWTVLVGSSNHDLIYMLRWGSLEERESRWGLFTSDPEWLEARRSSESNGPIVASVSSQLLTPTPFSRLP